MLEFLIKGLFSAKDVHFPLRYNYLNLEVFRTKQILNPISFTSL